MDNWWEVGVQLKAGMWKLKQQFIVVYIANFTNVYCSWAIWVHNTYSCLSNLFVGYTNNCFQGQPAFNYSNINPPSSKPSTTDPERQFFHLEFHPKDISRNRIQQLYKTHCNLPDKDNNSFLTGYENKHGNLMKINKLTIAYSRPKNLRDHLCPSKLPTPSSLPSITSYINTTLYKNLPHHPTTYNTLSNSWSYILRSTWLHIFNSTLL